MTTLYARDLLPHHVLRDNVLAVWSRATSHEYGLGAAWYLDARTHAHCIADIAGVSMAAAAGVIAVLSPQIEWTRNLEEAYRMATAHADGVLVDDNTFGAFRRNVYKAYDILQTPDRVADIVSGPKVTAFWRAIAGLPGGPVVDRHATRVATGYAYDGVTARTYTAVQQAYIDAAERLHQSEHTIQATVWLVCKRELASTIGQLTLGLDGTS